MTKQRSKPAARIPRRPMGRTGLEVSVLSIGAMRLPQDMDEAVALLRHMIDSGLNYIDTSRGYGDSELKLARALKDGYRDRVVLSTKCSPWIFKKGGDTTSADDTRRRIDEQMKRLEVDRLDFYQVWNILDAERYELAMAKGGVVDGIRKAVDEGLVDHIGTTAHAPDDVVTRIVDSGVFETVTVSYHLLNRQREAVMQYAHEKGVGVVVMNPLGGGVLAFETDVIRNLLPEAGRSSVELSLRYVLDNPHITCAISGMSKTSDVDDNVRIARSKRLTAKQRARLAEGVAKLNAKEKTYCTQCGYCMPCPHGVNIKQIFDLVNRAEVFGLEEWAKRSYAGMRIEEKADRCAQCHDCEKKCTNHLAIPDELAAAHRRLS